ncbi:TPA: hypothetical protein ACHGAU_001869 [Escherichia coli]|nr:hypothetical protein [Escherichia coli]MCU6469450.1 hypothetical protein [Escherichia coli]MDM4971792.1 hypothetical protein [Escherichia coli]
MTRNKQQAPEITAATLIKDSAECLASVPALIQQANAKNLRRAASFIRAGITRQMMIAQLCMREAQRLEQMETNGD